MLNHKYRPSLLLVAVFLCSNFASANEVNVYSARKEALIKPALDNFSKQTNIKVNLITGKADALLTRLRLEGKASPADVFITVDAGRLYRAKQAGVLQAIQNKTLNDRIPANLRDTDNFWFGLSQRARPIFYALDKVNPEELSSYENLANNKWKSRICMRSSNSVYNPVGGDTDQLKAVAAGQCDITIANTYYFGRLINSKDPADTNAASKIGIFWPNQTDRGTHVNVSGAGVTAHAKNVENAIKLIEFLSSKETQAWYSSVNNEYPVVPGSLVSDTLASWGEFKQDTVDLTVLGEKNRATVELMDKANWK